MPRQQSKDNDGNVFTAHPTQQPQGSLEYGELKGIRKELEETRNEVWWLSFFLVKLPLIIACIAVVIVIIVLLFSVFTSR